MEAKTDTHAEAKFWEWLATYKDGLGGPLGARFLSAEHLREAFQAGFDAGQGED